MKKKFNYLYHVYYRKKKKNRSVNIMVADDVAPYVAGPSAPMMFDHVR